MILKPQDIVVLLKLVAARSKDCRYSSLALELGVSSSEVHAGARRLLAARLVIRDEQDVLRPAFKALLEFLEHGIQYVFVPDRGELVRGMPTAEAAPPLNQSIVQSGEPPPVWPDPEGEMRGCSFSPLYKSVPFAARRDQQLYELLALVDAVRGGRIRERNTAFKELRKRMEAAE